MWRQQISFSSYRNGFSFSEPVHVPWVRANQRIVLLLSLFYFVGERRHWERCGTSPELAGVG